MNSVLVLNKPKGLTSQEAVTEVKKIIKVKKAGHAGTLDPMATGVLLVCTNEATKITPFLMELEKEYLFKARFGISTDTYDAEGKILNVVEDFQLDKEKLQKVLQKFTGQIMQTPPMYSASKVEGQPLYKLARKGIEVERKPKKIFVYSIEIEEFSPPFVTFRVKCSKGTYVRSICHDIGQEMGVGAHIVELIRTRIGEFSVENSVSLDDLKKTEIDGQKFLSIDKALYFLPSVNIQDNLISRFLNGASIKIPSGIVPAGWVKVKNKAGKILGIGFGNGVIVKPERIIWEVE